MNVIYSTIRRDGKKKLEFWLDLMRSSAEVPPVT